MGEKDVVGAEAWCDVAAVEPNQALRFSGCHEQAEAQESAGIIFARKDRLESAMTLRAIGFGADAEGRSVSRDAEGEVCKAMAFGGSEPDSKRGLGIDRSGDMTFRIGRIDPVGHDPKTAALPIRNDRNVIARRHRLRPVLRQRQRILRVVRHRLAMRQRATHHHVVGRHIHRRALSRQRQRAAKQYDNHLQANNGVHIDVRSMPTKRHHTCFQ